MAKELGKRQRLLKEPAYGDQGAGEVTAANLAVLLSVHGPARAAGVPPWSPSGTERELVLFAFRHCTTTVKKSSTR